MQSKQAFVHFKSQKIWKSDPKWLPEGDPKSIKNHEKSILGPSKAPLCASLLNLITKIVPKDPKMIENCHLVTLILGSTPKLSGVVLFEDTSAGWGLAGQQSEGSSKLNRCKPCISSNPSLTSGCNHKGGRRQGRSLRNPPPPRRVWRACQFHWCSSSGFQGLEAQGRSAPFRRPLPFLPQNLIKNRIKKKFNFLI